MELSVAAAAIAEGGVYKSETSEGSQRWGAALPP
jgi:hypothetical protein